MDKKKIEDTMQKGLESLMKDFSGLRAGRASSAMLDNISVYIANHSTPLKSLSTFSAIDSRTLGLRVWDLANTKAVEKALREVNLGLNLVIEGGSIRITFPELTQERREEFIKVARKHAEQAKLAIRSVRRTALDELKVTVKKDALSKDQEKRLTDEIQKMTDKAIKEIDKLLTEKESELRKV